MGRVRRLATGFVRLLLWLFFRRIEVTGRDDVPRTGGGVYVAWHPNGLLDPALILTRSPRPVVFGARHTLFDVPVLGALMRALGTVPIRRPQESVDPSDEEGRRAANRQALEGMAEVVASGSFATLFPEGTSHDAPHLADIRPGASRLWLRAAELSSPELRPALIPIGLHYDRKNVFLSSALVEFHPPIEIPEEWLELDRKEAEQLLTAKIGEVLTEVVHATEDWETHELMHRLRKMLRAEIARRERIGTRAPSMRERVTAFSMIRDAYERGRREFPEKVRRLRARVSEYHAELESMKLEDHELDGVNDAHAPLRALLLVGQAALTWILLPPLLLLGYLVNIPTAYLLRLIVSRMGAYRKDEASLKVLVGAVLFPFVWASVAALTAWGVVRLDSSHWLIPAKPWPTAVVTFLLCSVGGYIGVRYLRMAAELRRAVRSRLTRARRRATVDELLADRSEIHDEAMALAEAVER